MIIKNAEGDDDDEERLKNLNKTVETIIALHYREQCLLLADCCATVLRDAKLWLKIPLCKVTRAAIKGRQTPSRMQKAAQAAVYISNFSDTDL